MKLAGFAKLKILVFLVLFISIIFIMPADLVAEIHKFWVDTSHWETRPTECIARLAKLFFSGKVKSIAHQV